MKNCKGYNGYEHREHEKEYEHERERGEHEQGKEKGNPFSNARLQKLGKGFWGDLNSNFR